MATYSNIILAAAQKNGMTSAQAKALNFMGMRALAGIKGARDDPVPADFYWETELPELVQALERKEARLIVDEVQAAAEAVYARHDSSPGVEALVEPAVKIAPPAEVAEPGAAPIEDAEPIAETP